MNVVNWSPHGGPMWFRFNLSLDFEESCPNINDMLQVVPLALHIDRNHIEEQHVSEETSHVSSFSKAAKVPFLTCTSISDQSNLSGLIYTFLSICGSIKHRKDT